MPSNAIVLVFDGLQPAYLGPYGNNSLHTPAFNALAAESLLLENHLVDAPGLAAAYRAWWTGVSAVEGNNPTEAPPPLAEALDDAAIHVALITDEPALLAMPTAERFSERITVPQPVNPARAAAEVEHSQLAKVLAAAVAWLEESPPQPFLLWVHARALVGPWDAPYEMREALADDEDPDPPREVAPPELSLPAEYDPDRLLGHTQAYGAQVMLADMCLGMFLEALHDSRWDRRALLALTAGRGYPLGEHRQVGMHRELLYSEALHTPLLLRFPEGNLAAFRERRVVHPTQLHAALCQWFSLPEPATKADLPQLLSLRESSWEGGEAQQVLVSEQQWALRTAEWLLIIDREELRSAARTEPLMLGAQGVELYAKPDDRYEFNNVATLCQREVHDLAEQLLQLLPA